MALIYSFIVLIVFPASSWAFTCRYNDSAVILRKTVSLELEDHNYIHIRDATFDIRPKIQTVKSTFLAKKNYHPIEDISFEGYLVKGYQSEYINVTLTNLKSYRYKKHDNTCRVSFHRTTSEELDITAEQEAAITRLAESCIQSRVCGIDLMEIDVDSDLYYQSVQYSVNGLVDFYVPRLLKLILENDGSYKTPAATITENDISLHVKNGLIKGLDTIQRANDVVIKNEKSKFKISLVVRFAELNVFLNNITAEYSFFYSLAFDLNGIIEGLSSKTDIIIDVQPSTCKITLDDTKVISFKKIKLNVPVWGWIKFSYNLDSNNLWLFESVLLSYIIKSIPQLNFDCTQYLNQLLSFASL